MSEFGPEAIAVDTLHSLFAKNPRLKHLRARKRGRVVTILSGPEDDAHEHVRLRRDTVHLWLLEMPARGGRWDRTPFRDSVERLVDLLQTEFGWTLAPLDGGHPDGTSDPGY